jgi:RNA polymerase primary sigma factor
MLVLRRHGVEILDAELENDLAENDLPLSASDMDGFSNLESISSDDTIGLYLKEMSRVPLLKISEELEIARRIEAGRASKKELDRSNGGCPADRKLVLKNLIEDGILDGNI